ncbi:hypothetical protein LUZ61_002823 [Rhynchospora tenuis]|uniref:Pectinesterase n=1 Tax=Rhynchospora tenuis TaxID=198213 RepID=A0AAD6ES19_9POAL|nr:hypothetical protein LUZ61_002823 [Rhynchospora tenuis]
MEAIRQLRGYGKVNSDEDRVLRRDNKQRLLFTAVSVAVLLAVTIGVAITAFSSKESNTYNSYPSQLPPFTSSLSDTIKAICGLTSYPDLCYITTISPTNGSDIPNDPIELLKISLYSTMDEIANISSFVSTLNFPLNDKRLGLAIKDCNELLDGAVSWINNSISLLSSKPLTDSTVADLRAWLSAGVTNQETCLDGFDGTSGSVKDKLLVAMSKSTKLTSNSLAIATGILGLLKKLNFRMHRRKLLSIRESDFRRQLYLLQDPTQLAPNVTVAKDGSGLVVTISEAVNLAPLMSDDPFVIHVKAGVYHENVIIGREKWNVILIGDGMYKTIVDGRLNFDDGTPTFSTPTFAIDGKRFLAKNMGFRNSAGPQNHQAVALRSSSDLSVFYRCSFDGFHNTLYAHSLRQFYCDCDISGTVDFIFGDAAAVFQNCTIRPRQPLTQQVNTITGQGKKDPNESTGFSIQGCIISPYNDNTTVAAYLGRSMKNYSTVMVMQSNISSVVDLKGWIGSTFGSVPPDTATFLDFRNTGSGSNVAGQVNWAGYRKASTEDAKRFTVDSFLKGSEWIPETGVPFKASLN